MQQNPPLHTLYMLLAVAYVIVPATSAVGAAYVKPHCLSVVHVVPGGASATHDVDRGGAYAARPTTVEASEPNVYWHW